MVLKTISPGCGVQATLMLFLSMLPTSPVQEENQYCMQKETIPSYIYLISELYSENAVASLVYYGLETILALRVYQVIKLMLSNGGWL